MQTREEKNAYNREYYKRNRERYLAKHAEYRESNREQRRASDHEYKKRVKGTASYKLRTRWEHMIQRCMNPQCHDYKNYGGRGITVCDEWKEFSAFEEWAMNNGFSAELGSYECTLDRIDVNGNYEPSNCRWVDMKTQQNNKRNNVAYRQTGS